MIQRKTQNLAYWRDEYQVDEADHEFLYEILIDAPTPMSLEHLALALVKRRCQAEESRIRNELTRGLIYDPKDSYAEGDHIVFPAFDFSLAEVVAKRAEKIPNTGPST